jgi:hypothetical protein
MRVRNIDKTMGGTMNLLHRAALLTLCCTLLWSCSSDKPRPEGVTLTPSGSAVAAATPEAQSQIDVCSYFSAADAQSIMGVPMKRSDKTNPQRNCMYEEVKARPNTIGAGTVSLTLVQSKSLEDENKKWANLREVRHLQNGQKNVRQLGDIGDEAWFDGNTEKGKVGVASVIVRKGASQFMLDNMVLEYIASPEAMKKVANRIAGQL